jgi:glycine/D-amino acid oxidase-like deaminating enzyme
MSLHADILVLGAGLAGAATAYHLRRRRVGKIVILEQEDLPGQHATGRNAAMIRAHVADEALRPLLAEGAAALHTGELAEFHRTGSFLIGLGDEDAARYVPLATGRGRFFPNDGVIDPAGLLASYLRGLDVCCGTRVLRWQADASGVRVETPTETWTAGLLVNAAGPWAGHVGALPLRPLNRHLFLTPPMPEVDPDWPFVWDLPNGLYFRPESGGLLLCPCDEEAREAGDYRVSPAAQERLAELLVETQPKLAEIAIRRC